MNPLADLPYIARPFVDTGVGVTPLAVSRQSRWYQVRITFF